MRFMAEILLQFFLLVSELLGDASIGASDP